VPFRLLRSARPRSPVTSDERSTGNDGRCLCPTGFLALEAVAAVDYAVLPATNSSGTRAIGGQKRIFTPGLTLHKDTARTPIYWVKPGLLNGRPAL
jgi:hypothetical protein